MFFAELGAKVIKVENKLTGGDVTRQWKLPSESKSEKISAYFASVNYGKKSIFLDFNNKQDKQKLYKLIEYADIVISNYKKGDAEKWGMDYSVLKKIKPDIIYAHISGYGTHSDRVAYDVVLQAESGFMAMNGNKISGPMKMPVAIIDLMAAHQMKEAILVAMINRLKTGKGAFVTVSLYDSAIASLANQGSNWLMEKYIPERMGSLHPNIAPYGEIVKTKDNKEIVLAVGNNDQYKNLCIALGDLSLVNDKKFSNNVDRLKHRKILKSKLDKLFSKKNASQWMKIFADKNIPAGVCTTIDKVLREDKAAKMTLSYKNVTTKKILRSLKTVVFEITSA